MVGDFLWILRINIELIKRFNLILRVLFIVKSSHNFLE